MGSWKSPARWSTRWEYQSAPSVAPAAPPVLTFTSRFAFVESIDLFFRTTDRNFDVVAVFVGRSTVEQGKSLGIVLLAGLTAVSLWQVANARAVAVGDQQARASVESISERFAIALTTYDYAHPAVQAGQVAAVSAPSVRERVGTASRDLVLARASSFGEATGAVVSVLTSDRADVLVRTSQVVSGSYEVTTARLYGLLEVRLSRLKEAGL
jgi:hypothetical protein